MNIRTQQHWQEIYATSDESQTSWFRPHLDTSLRLIDSLGLPASRAIIDVGAGRSTLVEDLIARGFREVTALDISPAALSQSRRRMGLGGDLVRWINADILTASLPSTRFDLWHDRAVFHFLIDEAEQARYAALAARVVRDGGHLLVASFAPDGPKWCSGLPVCRYDAAGLAARFPDFSLVADAREEHRTPGGSTQPFTYVLLRKNDAEPEAETEYVPDSYTE
jgi:SAM-dependent methyltransferase